MAIIFKVRWDLQFFEYMRILTRVLPQTRAQKFTQTQTGKHSQIHIYTQCDTQLLANQMNQSASPKGQTADLGSSTEFICQLEIAHGAHKHIHKLANT